MPKILIAEWKQEVASFNPGLSRYEDFRVSFGDDVIDRHRDVRSEVVGALSVFESRAGVQVVPAYSARSLTSGGILAAADFERIAITSALRSRP